MMKRLFLLLCAIAVVTVSAMAVPAKRGVKKTLTLKDGTRVEATLTGDEFVNYYLTDDGKPIQLLDDSYQFVDRETLVKEHTRLMSARNKQRAARRRAGTAPEGGYKGQKKGLVLLVEFTDVKFTYDRETFVNYFNKVGFSEQGMHGSVHDYFYEQSYGQFDLEFDVVGPFKANTNARYYSTDNKRVATLVNTVCKQADDQVDFTKYDWDGDGVVDQVYVIYAGYGAAQGAENTIWPHEWTVQAGGTPYTTQDGPTINTYGISCELMGSTGSNLDGIGTSCHEFSHCLGLPDFYDTKENGTNFGMSVWSLMDYGCYNGDNNGQCPCGYTAYERWFAGWLTPTELYSSQQVTDMPALEDSPVAYIMYNDNYKDEYYLLANHQQKGFDEAQFGHGLLVLHVDYNANYWTSNTVNNTNNHERMTIIPADNVRANSAVSLAGDPFPGTKHKSELTDESTPAATLYNENTAGTKLMGKPITEIMEVEGLLTFNVMGGQSIEAPTVAEASNITDTSFRANWQAYSGALEYTVALTQTLASDNPWDFLMLGENFENFETSVAGSTDLSGQLDDYTKVAGWEGENIFTSPNRARVGKASKPGRLVSPVLEAPSQEALSVAFTPLSTSLRSTGELELRIMLADDTTQYAKGTISNVPIVGSEDDGTTWLLHLDSWPYGGCRVGIVAKGSGVYMQYLGVFDGSYSWDDFPKSTSSPAHSRLHNQKVKMIELSDLTWNTTGESLLAPAVKSVPRQAKKITETFYTTTENHYDFDNLVPANYSYKVRVKTSEGYSPWSEEVSVDINTGIEVINNEHASAMVNSKCYDLSGRQLMEDKLRKGIYIRNGRKFVVK